MVFAVLMADGRIVMIASVNIHNGGSGNSHAR